MAEYCLKQIIEEEETYQFTHLSRSDIWELGCDLVAAYGEFEGPLAAEIDINGTNVFRYYPEGTNAINGQWLERKRKTVQGLEKSSLRVLAELEEMGETLLHYQRLDPMDYADCGGGFPIRMRGGCVIGFIGASGLPHWRDHAAIVAGLKRYFAKHPQG